MATHVPRIVHPHISRQDDVCGGSPIIAGIRFPVRSVVFYVLRLGFTAEDLVERFPRLTLAQVYGALADLRIFNLQCDRGAAFIPLPSPVIAETPPRPASPPPART